jgi:hypothetical protein
MKKLYSEGIVDSDDLEFNFEEAPAVTLMGVIRFGTAVELKVKKFLRIELHGKRQCLVTKRYSYQCHVVGQTKGEIFRYDNYHEDNPHKGHYGPHHVHRFDPPGKQAKGSPFHVEGENRPTLEEVIREAAECSRIYIESVSTKGPRTRKQIVTTRKHKE